MNGNARRLAAGYLSAGVVVGILPARLRPPCPLRVLTGRRCPMCGSASMAHLLLRGRPVRAWRANRLGAVLAVASAVVLRA